MKTKQIALFSAALAAVSMGVAPAASTPAQASSSLSAEWWQWALSVPASVNPLLDTKGAYCMVGQHGKVWFLAGYFGDNAAPITRECTVPANTTLFFPVYNSINIDTPNVCGQDSSSTPVSVLRARSADSLSHVTQVAVTIDGVPASTLKRVQSAVFAVALPQQSLFAPLCANSKGGLPKGVYAPAVDDGFYVTLGWLAKGNHTLCFTVRNDSGQLIQNISYHLRVVSAPQP